MTVSPAANTIHGANTIRSVAVIRVALPLLVLVMISASGGGAGPVKLTW